MQTYLQQSNKTLFLNIGAMSQATPSKSADDFCSNPASHQHRKYIVFLKIIYYQKLKTFKKV